MAVQLMTKAAYARHRSCDEKAVRKAIAEGRISTIDGKIDPAVADIQWANNTRARAGSAAPTGAVDLASAPSPAPAPAAPTDNGYQALRVRRELAEAEKAEMETARMAGRLIDRETTSRSIYDAFHQLRDAVMSASPRTAPKVIGMADARDIELAFTTELRKAFEGWEQRMQERLTPKDNS